MTVTDIEDWAGRLAILSFSMGLFLGVAVAASSLSMRGISLVGVGLTLLYGYYWLPHLGDVLEIDNRAR